MALAACVTNEPMPDTAERRSVHPPSRPRNRLISHLEIKVSEQHSVGEFWNNRYMQLLLAYRDRLNCKHLVGRS